MRKECSATTRTDASHSAFAETKAIVLGLHMLVLLTTVADSTLEVHRQAQVNVDAAKRICRDRCIEPGVLNRTSNAVVYH